MMLFLFDKSRDDFGVLFLKHREYSVAPRNINGNMIFAI